MKFLPFAAIIALFLVTSCSTDVELNAPYKSTTIVFGLLNPDFNGDTFENEADTQWIKINKTFLGEGDNNDYAAFRDSSEYKDEDFEEKKVERYYDGEWQEDFPLQSITISNKNIDGIFYGPEQTLYYFIPPNNGLDVNSEYRIYLRFTGGREVTASTNIVDNGTSNWISPQQENMLQLANVSTQNNPIYVSQVSLRWGAAENATVYSATLRFHFTEIVYATSDWSGTPISITPRTLDYALGNVSSDNAQPGSTLKVDFNGAGFYEFVNNSLTASANIKRVIGVYDGVEERTECFDVLLTMGNEELDNYIKVNTPSTGIVQEKPIYTNVNNGMGLFASRGAINLFGLPLLAHNPNGSDNQGNLFAFITGITSGLNFCDPNPTSDYHCN